MALDTHTVQKLEREKQILQNAKEARFRKDKGIINTLKKQLAKKEKEIKKLNSTIVERDKSIQMQQVKIRHYLQANAEKLPTDTFMGIENMIEDSSRNPRKMADVYRRVKEI